MLHGVPRKDWLARARASKSACDPAKPLQILSKSGKTRISPATVTPHLSNHCVITVYPTNFRYKQLARAMNKCGHGFSERGVNARSVSTTTSYSVRLGPIEPSMVTSMVTAVYIYGAHLLLVTYQH